MPRERHGFVVVTRPGEGLGFRLAGVVVEEVPPGEELARIRVLLADPTLAVLAVDQDVLAAAPEATRRRPAERGPVVLPFAVPRRWAEPGRGEEYVAALIRRAIGYHVKVGPPKR